MAHYLHFHSISFEFNFFSTLSFGVNVRLYTATSFLTILT